MTPRPARPPRLPFGFVVVALLGAGFVGLLGLNTASAQNAFRQHQLQARSGLLADREQALEVELQQLGSPSVLADRARRLGMRPTTVPRYLRVAPTPARRGAVGPDGEPDRCDGGRGDGSLCRPPGAP